MKIYFAGTLFVFLLTAFFHTTYGQVRQLYKTIETVGVSYFKIEEVTNMAFGGTNISYTVSDLRLISKVDLGPNNIRIITPVYKNKKRNDKEYYIETKNDKGLLYKATEPIQLIKISIKDNEIKVPENVAIDQNVLAFALSKIMKIEKKQLVVNANVATVPVIKDTIVKADVLPQKRLLDPLNNPVSSNLDTISSKAVIAVAETPKDKLEYVNVNIISVYEQVLERGYKSEFMFKEVADFYYYEKQLDKAVRWYTALFEATNNVEAECYFRFGDALNKTGKTAKGEAMIEKFRQLKN